MTSLTRGLWSVLFVAISLCRASVAHDASCPCIDSSSPQYAAIQNATRKKYPEGYGIQGCYAYDKGNAAEGCGVGSTASYCESKWCYVDPIKCPISKAQCEAEGLIVGSFESPACRERAMASSSLLEGVFYSYETCGYLNGYDASRISAMVAGHRIHAAVMPMRPYSVLEEIDGSKSDLLGWTGALMEWIYEIFLSFEPRVELTLNASGATPISRNIYASSYTACVLDVAVGNYDMCIGDFWVTPERILLTQFLPQYDADKMYLVTVRNELGESVSDHIKKPFKPFSEALWGLIISYLVFAGVVHLLTESADNEDDFDSQNLIARFMKCQYLSFIGFVSGGAGNSPRSIPARLATLGFGFFILITLASYTANLASLLVQQSTSNAIESIHDCVEQNLPVCVPQALESEMAALNLNGKLRMVLVTWTQHIPAHIHAGDCVAGVMYELAIQQTLAGEFNALNCEEGHPDCVRDSAGAPLLTRDCDLVQVGGLLTTVALSMPVSDRWSHALGWATVQSTVDGDYDAMKQRFEHYWPQAACGAEEEEQPGDDGSLPASSMYGTFLVAVAFQLLALVLAALEKVRGESLQTMLGFAAAPREAQAAERGSEGRASVGAGGESMMTVQGKSTAQSMPTLGGTSDLSDEHLAELRADVKQILTLLRTDNLFPVTLDPVGTA